MKIIKQNTVVLCSLLFFLFTVVDTAAGDERVSRPESAEEMEWHRQNLEEEIDLRKKAQAAIDAKIPLAEKDPYRPVFHFRPPAQWMNDICGAIFYKGYYHIIYQYNPHSGDHWGANYTAWAHARSKDMVTWEDLPWSFMPMKNRGERRCNSGCVTVDENGRPMIFYTFVPQNNTSTKLGKRVQWAAIPSCQLMPQLNLI